LPGRLQHPTFIDTDAGTARIIAPLLLWVDYRRSDAFAFNFQSVMIMLLGKMSPALTGLIYDDRILSNMFDKTETSS
jgi:hypothetical protein